MTGATFGLITEGANAAGAYLTGAVPHRRIGGERIAQAGLNAEFDTHQPQQPALVIDLGFGAADHPAPFAGGMAHAMQTFEQRCFAGDMIADRSLHSGHVV